MVRTYVLRRLLRQDSLLQHSNITLLKKTLLCLHDGWFRVNNCSPQSRFTLADYLFDNQRIIIDFNRLSENHRTRFLGWYLHPHRKDAKKTWFNPVATNDYKGYTTEVGLDWWGILTNLVQDKRKLYSWNIAPLELTLDYQLNDIEICEGEHGLLVGFNQCAVDMNDNKYSNIESLNTKRLYLTDNLVNDLVLSNLQNRDYDSILDNPHPYAIEHLCSEKPVGELKSEKNVNNQFDLLIKKDKIQVFRNQVSGKILIIEKRPDLDCMVFCGGGARIYAHVGAYKAFEDALIRPTKFSGSSAGAVMAIFCYLGYDADEILSFFRKFRHDILVHYDIDSSGLSDSCALKAGIDFMIVKKINQIVSRYRIMETEEGKFFLANHVFKNGIITFSSLQAIKNRYPDCGFGNNLVITATNVEQQKTRYFSFAETPSVEVSMAGMMSSSYPVVFKPTRFEGDAHNDGGVLNNLPTEAFSDDYSTLLESEHGNCLSLVAFQFDNGVERGILDNFVQEVYRENFVVNWFYGLLTGVKDSASAWEKDRLKLLKYSNQVVLIPVENVSSTEFDIDTKTQDLLFQNGYQASKNYINIRYEQSPDSNQAVNEEYMHATFVNIQEAINYCCYRGRQDWFEILVSSTSDLNAEKIEYLRQKYFPLQSERHISRINPTGRQSISLSYQMIASADCTCITPNIRLFEALYPVFLKLPCTFVINSSDLKLFKSARHALSLEHPLHCLPALEKIGGDMHILLSIVIKVLNDFKLSKINIEMTCDILEMIHFALDSHENLHHPCFYGKWNLLDRHQKRILENFQMGNWKASMQLCDALKLHAEPLQNFINFSEDEDEDLLEELCRKEFRQ